MDDILEVLVSTSQEMDTSVSTELIENCYYIEKKFQFELDRNIPLNEMRNEVNTEIESTATDSLSQEIME